MRKVKWIFFGYLAVVGLLLALFKFQVWRPSKVAGPSRAPWPLAQLVPAAAADLPDFSRMTTPTGRPS